VGYDILIVSGRSAGWVLANRLSAEPGRDVVLIEAGPDFPSAAILTPTRELTSACRV
jgi:5-(hydroxymethyl)furfural/furfural oxidase